MALILGEDQAVVFLHIPKTGGTWFKQAAYASDIKFIEYGNQHGNVAKMLQDGKDEAWFNGKFVFTIVRHPVTWYQSRWCFRVKHGWHGEHPMDMACASNDFPTFVDNVLKYKPDGWVSWIYRNYNEHRIHPTDHIVRTENLTDDLVKCLNLAGVEFDEEKFRGCRWVNDSSMEGHSSKYWAKYTPELLDRVIAVEQDAITKYYPDAEINRDDFIGECPYA